MYASLTLQIFSRLYVIENFKYSRWGHYCVIILGRRIRYKFIRHFAFHCQLNLVDTRYIRCILFLQIFVHYQRIIFLLLQSGARCNLEWYFYMATVVLPLLDSIEQASFKRRWRERERERKNKEKKSESLIDDPESVILMEFPSKTKIHRARSRGGVSRDVGTTNSRVYNKCNVVRPANVRENRPQRVIATPRVIVFVLRWPQFRLIDSLTFLSL